MDLITLDANNQPAKLIENYDSLIWTERFNTKGQTDGVGDFQLTTGNVDAFMSLLPEGTIVSLRESNVPMIVEDRIVERKKNAPQKLTIVGRSFDSVLDRRVAIQGLISPMTDWVVNLKTPSDVAYYIMYQICVTGIVDPADIFPSAQFKINAPADYGTSTGPTKAFTVPRGNLYDVVLDLLQTEAKADPTTSPASPAVTQHGIRSVRPNSSGTANAIEIYTGVDRSATVYFDATRDLLDDGNYLFSKRGSATAAYAVAQTITAKMEQASVPPTGFGRRVILVDATSSGITDPNVLKVQASMSLADAHETAMFDGSINQDLSPYKYGVDYNLGDIVRVVGDYGLDQHARVTEYIRSEDATGVKAYPTLTALTSYSQGA